VKKTTVAAALSLWFVVLMIACGRDLIVPTEQ